MNGVLLVDKESGVTSHDVVADVRRLFNMREVGHGGTLDPLATGLLICLVGEATKLSSYVMSEEKSYRVGVRLGIQTDSGDITGKVIKEGDFSAVTKADIEKHIQALTGVLALPVPKYSAVKVNGRKLYEYARKHEDVQIPTKDMTIKRVELLECQLESSEASLGGFLSIDLDCEKGTYVRSWVERLGELLGCGATVQSLRRLRSGPFSIDACRKISQFSDGNLKDSLVPLPLVMGAWPALKVLGRDLHLVRNGQIPNGIFTQLLHFNWRQGVRLLTEEGDLLALVIRDQEKGLKLARVFNSKC